MSEPLLAALVTGGGRGIGKAISIRLAKDRPVLMVGRDEASLRETTQLIRRHRLADYVPGDITEDATREHIIQKLKTLQWNISSLVLNASIGKSGASEKIEPTDFRRPFDVNVHAGFRLAQMFLPEMMMRRNGTICFISSVLGLKGASHDAAYVSTKHAQIGLARALAVEYGKYGISVVPICPNYVESDMTSRSIASLAERKQTHPDSARLILEKTMPMRRIIPAKEVAEVVAFVCSGKVPSLSGNPLVLGGGAL